MSIKPNLDFWRVPARKIDGMRYYRFSVGYYHGKRRVVFAWFESLEAAMDYALRTSADKPHLKIDVLESIF